MPLVTTGFKLSVILVDTGGNTSTKVFDLQAATYAAAVTDAATIIAALNPITTAAIRSYSIAEKFEEDAFTFPTAAEIENQAEIVVRLATMNKYATIYVPSPIASIFVSPNGDGYNIVDGTDALVAAYLALFNAGAEAYLSDGETITPTVAQRFKSGKRIHRASRDG